ncbi:putative phage integrase [Gluconacetobacter diazotrophicus PA1 5]|uniref:Putative phage integrase n=1 Tax=Gluconacetobacter diazotrophicus (strain ATCC 49037 / DSM 5601 / CCUG 37298 / CIP 103539 / LMG 7603 / PAl5) TaxID=272568 RepID=A9HLP0_GLUDA|nr:phage integrase family protein [Gluconacetobacter diazotrophicus]CAP56194.1 putative phage integrase [Gluconacetobacter diazotrophicus PA1 5]
MTRAKGDIDPATGKTLPAGISCRGPKQYQARKQVDGKRYRKTFSTAALARRWLNETAAKVELGQFKDTSALDKQTIGDLVDRYAKECMDGRGADLTGHIPAILRDKDLPGVRLSKFCLADVRGFRDRMMSADYSPATVVKRLNLLASVIQHAISEWDTSIVNYASGRFVKRPEGADKKRNRRLDEDKDKDGKTEFDRLIVAVSDSVYPDDVWLVRWSIEQGTRRGEAIGLRWCDVDIERSLIKLGGESGKTKTHKTQEEQGPEIRPLTPGARRLLLEKRDTYETPPEPGDSVFSVGKESTFSMRYGRMVKRTGLHNLTFHDLRHEATSRLARLLPNPLDLKRVTGHRDLKSLDRYYQPVPESISKQIEEAERLAGIIAAEEGDDDE